MKKHEGEPLEVAIMLEHNGRMYVDANWIEKEYGHKKGLKDALNVCRNKIKELVITK